MTTNEALGAETALAELFEAASLAGGRVKLSTLYDYPLITPWRCQLSRTP